MEKEKILDLLRHPENLNKDTLSLVEELTLAYPYFTAGHVLLLRNLKNNQDERFFECLPKVAAMVPDRTMLFKFLVKNPPQQPRRSFSRKADTLIEKFLKEEPRIKPDRDFTPTIPDNADKSLQDNDDVISETLARMYLEQGNPVRAIQIYGKLCLLIPEKSSYFAGQIEKIKTNYKSNP